MNLNRLTKAQLIEAIKRVCDMNHRFRLALSDVVCDIEFEEEQAIEKEMDTILTRNIELKKQYAELLAPYKGWKIMDIPNEIFSEGLKLEEEIKNGAERYKVLHRKLVRLRNGTD